MIHHATPSDTTKTLCGRKVRWATQLFSSVDCQKCIAISLAAPLDAQGKRESA